MHKFKYALLALPMLLGGLAQAQTAGTITFTANKTAATGSLVPVLTWSTTPVASSCLASNGWSGTKFASGSETLASISASKTYTLTCTWGGGTATVNWTAPTKNSDGTNLTNLASFKVLYGTSSTNLANTKAIADKNAKTTTLTALGAGTWYFAMRAVNTAGVESLNGPVLSKVISGATGAKSVAITITPATTPPPPTNPTGKLKTSDTRVYDVTWDEARGVRIVGRQVGTVAIGKLCTENYNVATLYWGVPKSDATITVTPRSNSVIAKCTRS